MTAEERVRSLGNVNMSASCDCNTCEEARGRLVAAILAAERDAANEMYADWREHDEEEED